MMDILAEYSELVHEDESFGLGYEAFYGDVSIEVEDDWRTASKTITATKKIHFRKGEMTEERLVSRCAHITCEFLHNWAEDDNWPIKLYRDVMAESLMHLETDLLNQMAYEGWHRV